ncbi:hypothetical protein MMC09_005796 [Bachmanniomyces sp. S44760]|nr:hypothetical protein [Bachmanniomyces sp. S44760]
MHVLITGAGGFVGQALATRLLSHVGLSRLVLTDVVEPSPPPGSKERVGGGSQVQIECIKADLTSLETCQALLTSSLSVVYLLHGIMSGATEANMDLGLSVNLDASRQILDTLRWVNPSVKIVFTSTTAVFGPSKEPVSEKTCPLPGSSYGAQKLMVETLLNDYSRRGLLDGRIVRLPTVMIRPGKPTGAASSFCSGIFREPLNGERSQLPVSRETELWICSARTVVQNLVIAMSMPKERFAGGELQGSRVVNLPGVTVTVNDMLDALRKVGGEKALSLVEEKRDEATERIVESWPPRFDTTRAKLLEFMEDGTLEKTVQEYIEDYAGGS